MIGCTGLKVKSFNRNVHISHNALRGSHFEKFKYFSFSAGLDVEARHFFESDNQCYNTVVMGTGKACRDKLPGVWDVNYVCSASSFIQGSQNSLAYVLIDSLILIDSI